MKLSLAEHSLNYIKFCSSTSIEKMGKCSLASLLCVSTLMPVKKELIKKVCEIDMCVYISYCLFIERQLNQCLLFK